MKVVYEYPPTAGELTFPRLMMSHKGQVIIVFDMGDGDFRYYLLTGDEEFLREHWCSETDLGAFKDYEGSVTLSN